MDNKSFKRTTITLEVISDADWEWDDLHDLAYDITEGPYSGRLLGTSVEFLSDQAAREALIAQGSDPEFLLGDDNDD